MSSSIPNLGNANWQESMCQDFTETGNNKAEDEGVTVKPMRLKVLYTFDDQNKTNCLARWPHVLQIRTVAMDDGPSIGVIELKVCIQAIVQCSPEIVAKLGHDYTVYAYDYSEYENPLVGQGMLSWALAASSPTPEAPAHQSNQLITGRVCKNIQGLFSNGVKETLEVKLRLVPVPTVLQSEYLSSMEKYRELSKAMPVGFDHNEWFAFLKSNPNMAQMANKINAPSSSNQRDGASMEVVNQLLSPSLSHHPSMDLANNEVSEINIREEESTEGRKAGSISRPSSRASVKRPRKPRAKSMATGGNTSGYEEGTDGDDCPPLKKRAKTTKTDWKSKAQFGTAADSLRVAASTAGSIRLFRPIAVAPSQAQGSVTASHLQEMPRAPTPTPFMQAKGGKRSRANSQADLRRGSLSNLSSLNQPYQSPYTRDDSVFGSQDQVRMSVESAMTSPERHESPLYTPRDINSSPPEIRSRTPLGSSPPMPSSPVLPKMPGTDSGFMSEEVNRLFDDDDEPRPVDQEDVAAVTKYTRKRAAPRTASKEVHHGFAIQEVTPGPPELLPTKMLPRVAPKRGSYNPAQLEPPSQPEPFSQADNACFDDSQNFQNFQAYIADQSQSMDYDPTFNMLFGEELDSVQLSTPNEHDASHTEQTSMTASSVSQPSLPRPSSRMMGRTASAGSLTLPMVSASDNVLPPSTLHRSQTWSEGPGATDNDNSGVTKGTLVRKTLIRQRLEEAIAKGEMPLFCSNCGAIETPTWRRAWAKDFEGDPGYHEYSDQPGKVTCIDILARDETGKPTAYRMIKKAILSGVTDGFEDITLCNPCGIWMSKYKCSRPEDKWGVQAPKRPGEGKKRDRSKKQKSAGGTQEVATSDAYFQSDGPVDFMPPATEYGSPTETTEAPTEPVEAPPVQTLQAREQNQRQRASSMRPSRKSAMTSESASAALKRAIQSSPARWLGTRQSPIELEEESLGSTRRLLFPSPRKDEGSKVLGEVATNVIAPVPQFHSRGQSKAQVIDAPNKENCPPSPLFGDDDDVDIVKLFEEEMARPSRPTTPVQKSPSINAFKTPTRPTPTHRPVTRSISRSTPRIMMPSRTPCKTPTSAVVRRSPRFQAGVTESPFTASLNKLLSEANDNNYSIDFSLPDLGHSSGTGMNSDAIFHMPGFDPQSHDFFSTDVHIPSSPPQFQLYDDSMGLNEMAGLGMDLDTAMWNDFPNIGEAGNGDSGAGLVIDANGRARFDLGDTMKVVKVETPSAESQEQEEETKAQ